MAVTVNRAKASNDPQPNLRKHDRHMLFPPGVVLPISNDLPRAVCDSSHLITLQKRSPPQWCCAMPAAVSGRRSSQVQRGRSVFNTFKIVPNATAHALHTLDCLLRTSSLRMAAATLRRTPHHLSFDKSNFDCTRALSNLQESTLVCKKVRLSHMRMSDRLELHQNAG